MGELETLPIDREIVRLSGKKRPVALFIPTASGDSEKYWGIFQGVYGEKLGCKTDVLFLIRKKLSKKEIEGKILSADIVYVGGGNTLRMMKIWRKLGVDHILRKAWMNGAVMAGLSAGAICWFRYGVSDSRRFSNSKDTSFMRMRGLDFIHATVSPHHIREKKLRDPALWEILMRTPGIGLALDDNSALILEGEDYRLLATKGNVGIRKAYKQGVRIFSETIQSGKLDELLNIS